MMMMKISLKRKFVQENYFNIELSEEKIGRKKNVVKSHFLLNRGSLNRDLTVRYNLKEPLIMALQ